MTIELNQGEGLYPPTGHQHEIRFFVDGEPYDTDRREWTPNEIIREFGEKDPASNYLVRIEGHDRDSYQGKGDKPITIHEAERFQIVSTGPTPVS